MERIVYASNRAVPKDAMRCIACDRILPESANAVLAFIEDRWTVWHRGCFARGDEKRPLPGKAQKPLRRFKGLRTARGARPELVGKVRNQRFLRQCVEIP